LIADDIVVGDYVAAKFMGLDPENIPIVREAFEKYKYPLTQASLGKFDVTVNGVSMNVMSAGCTIRPFREPLGW